VEFQFVKLTTLEMTGNISREFSSMS